jgi:hypothetical protein
MIHGSREHQIARGETSALAQKNLLLRKINGFSTHVAPGSRRLLDHDAVRVGRCKFLNDNCVAAFRHNAAGKDACSFAGTDFTGEGMAGRNLTNHLKHDRCLGDVTAAHGIAVHCRNRRRWLRAERGYIFGENATEGFVERDSFRRQRFGVSQDTLQRFGDRHQRHWLGLRAPLA